MHGDTYFTVSESGTVKVTLKANRFKASCHNAENGLLTYLYLIFRIGKTAPSGSP